MIKIYFDEFYFKQIKPYSEIIKILHYQLYSIVRKKAVQTITISKKYVFSEFNFRCAIFFGHLKIVVFLREKKKKRNHIAPVLLNCKRKPHRKCETVETLCTKRKILSPPLSRVI